MISVSDGVLSTLCQKFGIVRERLTEAAGDNPDSDCASYNFLSDHGRMALKIISREAGEAIDKTVCRLGYAAYLGSNGVKIACPEPDINGGFYETDGENGLLYIAYITKLYPGRNPNNDELTDKRAESWGRITGRLHSVSLAYKGSHDGNAPDYKDEMTSFASMCRDRDIRSAWLRMGELIAGFSAVPNGTAFIINDNHQRNILVNGSEISVADFRYSAVQFLIQDIAAAGQGLMFGEAGGMLEPFTDIDRLRRFYSSFIEGYERENTLDVSWYSHIGEFINYRRLMLYTCLQDWLETQPFIQNAFKRRILDPPKFVL